MAAVGRRRKEGDRTPSGRLSRTLRDEIGCYPPGVVKRLADAATRGMADREWGTPIGRMFLNGQLTGLQFEAGRRWDTLSRLYTNAIAAPSPHPKAAAMGHIQAGAATDPDSGEGQAEARRHQRTVEGWMAANLAMMAAGPRFHAVVRNVCEQHLEPRGEVERQHLRNGLDALVDWWELTKETL